MPKLVDTKLTTFTFSSGYNANSFTGNNKVNFLKMESTRFQNYRLTGAVMSTRQKGFRSINHAFIYQRRLILQKEFAV